MHSSPLLKKLLVSYKNIHFVYVSSLSKFVSNTPYKDGLQCLDRQCKVIEESDYVEHNYSDALRLLTVYKFGGIYSDLDIVTLKELPPQLSTNFVSTDTSRRVANCFFKFEGGHPLLKQLLNETVSIQNYAYIKMEFV